MGRASAWRSSSWSLTSRAAPQKPRKRPFAPTCASYVDKGVLSKFAIPDRVMIVKELPLTSVGKVDKAALRERRLRTRPHSRARRKK